MPIFIALIVVGVIGVGGGSYAGAQYYQSDKYQKQADNLLSNGQYDEALVLYQKSLSKWNRDETRAKQDFARQEKEAAKLIAGIKENSNQVDGQSCLDRLKSITPSSRQYSEAEILARNCQAKLEEDQKKEAQVAKQAEEEAAKKAEEARLAEEAKKKQTTASTPTTSAPTTSTPSTNQSTAQESATPATPTESAPVASTTQTTDPNACTSNPNPVFTHHLTDTSKIVDIAIPPRIIGGHLKTHSYVETNFQRVPLYAPADMQLYGGVHLSHGSDPDDYGFDSKVSCEVMVRLGHITDPIQSIKDTFPTATTDSRTNYNITPINFKAGELLGYTTGTAAAGNWDFGLYNSSTKNRYADDPEWDDSSIYTTAVCPYDYFSTELKSAYSAKYIQDFGVSVLDGAFFCQQ